MTIFDIVPWGITHIVVPVFNISFFGIPYGVIIVGAFTFGLLAVVIKKFIV